MKLDFTIGIPTFDRPAELAVLINQLIECRLYELANILVFDDGSKCVNINDNFFRSFAANYNVTYIHNPVNRGYPYSLLTLFKECQTEYLICIADDDQIFPDQLPELVKFIKENKPDFISSKRLIKSDAKFANTKACYGHIKPQDYFDASAHASGLIYRVSSCIRGLKVLEERLNQKSDEALIYPQVLLLIMLLLEKKRCYWYSKPVVKNGYRLPSGILDSVGIRYFQLESRWRQLKAFEDLFLNLKNFGDANVLQKLLASNRRRIFSALYCAMSIEKPEFKKAYDRAIYIFCLRRIIRFFLKPLIKFLKR